MKTYHDPAGLPFALPITTTEAAALGITPADITAGGKRLDITTFGAWSIVRTVRGLTRTTEYNPETNRAVSCTFHGVRTMSHPRPTGYDMEGRVSVKGTKRRAFTTSQMFDIEGTLVEVGILHACKP